MTRILILGGTREAADLAKELVANGNHVITSLAGRTREPKPLSGDVRTGGFGGTDGLISYLLENKIEKLVDATHPFATQISANAQIAAKTTGITFEQKMRPPWKPQDGDNWITVSSIDSAREMPPKGSRILLALGSQHIQAFGKRSDVFYLVRMVDSPEKALTLPDHEILLGKPSPDWKEELKLLRAKDISHIICRNSGGDGAYAKIRAARELALPVIMIERPGV